MIYLNKVTVQGRCGQDPDVRALQNGQYVMNLSVATTETYKVDNERREKTTWHRLSVFLSEKRVNSIRQYIGSGTIILAEGKLVTRKWKQELKVNGQTVANPQTGEIIEIERTSTEIHVTPDGEFRFDNPPKRNGNGGYQQNGQQTQATEQGSEALPA